MESKQTKTFLIKTLFITKPDEFGEIIGETSRTITLKIISLSNESKSSNTFTHEFTKEDIEYYSAFRIGKTRRFSKTTLFEIGGSTRLIIEAVENQNN